MAQAPKPFPLSLETLRGIVAARLVQARAGRGDREADGREGRRRTPRFGLRIVRDAEPPELAGEPSSQPLIAQAIAHELRSTLALISGYSQTIQHLPLDNDVRVRYLERISTASSCLSELTDEILIVATSPQRAQEPQVEPVSLRQLYSEVASQVAAAVDPIELRVDIPTDLPLVDADPLWVALVVRNLLANGAKYAPGAPLILRAWQSAEWVVTSVADRGAGVDESERSRMFEPAFRGRRARESGMPGSGLGLYLCSRLVEAHGGRIWVDDAARGFEVCFTLPRTTLPLALGPKTHDGALAAGRSGAEHGASA